MNDVDSYKCNSDEVSSEIRKVLKELDITFVDSVILLIQGFNAMNHYYEKKNGEDSILNLFYAFSEKEKDTFAFCFRIADTINNYVLTKGEKSNND